MAYADQPEAPGKVSPVGRSDGWTRLSQPSTSTHLDDLSILDAAAGGEGNGYSFTTDEHAAEGSEPSAAKPGPP